jgi:hypothetical protein
MRLVRRDSRGREPSVERLYAREDRTVTALHITTPAVAREHPVDRAKKSATGRTPPACRRKSP